MTHAIDYMLGFVEKAVQGSISLHGWVAHSHVPDTARVLEKELRKRFNWVELRLFEAGPVLGTHMGPGLVGVGFYFDEDWHSE
jgi:fatty acid-binding protein DegV